MKALLRPPSIGLGAFLVLLLGGLLVVLPGDAHEMGPGRVEVVFTADGQYRIEARIDPETTLRRLQLASGEEVSPDGLPPADLETRLLERKDQLLEAFDLRFDGQAATPRLEILSMETIATPAMPSRTENDPQPSPEDLLRQLSQEPGVETTLRLSGPLPANSKTFTLAYSLPTSAYALTLKDERFEVASSQFLEGGVTSQPFDLEGAEPSRLEVARQYLVLGFTHILPKGLDHILFVLGIFLLSTRLRPILVQVTAFTLAHTLTLGLSIYGVVSLPGSVVEPLIALSIVYVAVENMLTRTLSPWRVVLVFAFGLLHGLGFAGVLEELGLPPSGFLTALVTFNIGVELGQLAVIALAFVLVASWARHRPWYRQRVVIPGSVAIALVGLFWTVQRVFG